MSNLTEHLFHINQCVTKKDISSIAKQVVNDQLNTGNILNTADVMARLEFFIKEIKSNPDYVDYVTSELSKHQKSYNTSAGSKIEMAELGTKYDYSVCGDSQWNLFNSKVEEYTKLRKEREEFLKVIPYEGIDVLSDEGELIHLNKPNKTSTTGYKVTIAK
jgi:hypothetical protein